MSSLGWKTAKMFASFFYLTLQVPGLLIAWETCPNIAHGDLLGPNWNQKNLSLIAWKILNDVRIDDY